MNLPKIAGHELQDLIGSGSVGAVYRATGPDGKPCAVKIFSSMAINRQGLEQTLQRLQAMPAHAGLLRVHSYDLGHPPLHLVMPLVGVMIKDAQRRKIWQCPTLDTMRGRLSSQQAWKHVRELAQALAWALKHGVAHGNLKCSNVLVTGDTNASVRVTDFGQGQVGGTHHLELRDHYMYLCPDQLEKPEGFFAGEGPSWDVYSFGVVAYRLLTGQFPRGAEAWTKELAAEQQGQENQIIAGGAVNGSALLEAVRAQPQITWPKPAANPKEERRRQVIERALHFDANERWRDLRDVSHEFDLIEAEAQLTEAKEQTRIERKRQTRKIIALHALWAVLLIGVGLAAAQWFLAREQLNSVLNTSNADRTRTSRELSDRNQKITKLEADLKQARSTRNDSDGRLQQAQSMVDQLMTQLLQLPASNSLEVAFSKQQLAETATFIRLGLPDLEANPILAPERARSYGNLGMIALKQLNTNEAMQYLDKARVELRGLLEREPNHPQATLYHQWLGRFSLLLANIYVGRGDEPKAFSLLQEATTHLDAGLKIDPGDRNTRIEAAQAWYEYGARCRAKGDAKAGESALQRVTAVLAPRGISNALLPEESFLLSRAELERGLALRDARKFNEAATMIVHSVEKMAQLVSGSAPANRDQAIILARAYTELAEILGAHFGAKEATEAHLEAIKVLLELLRMEPTWREVKYLLARNYGRAATLERGVGNNEEAMRKKQDALELINEVVSDERSNPRYLFEQARLRGGLAELMNQGGKPQESLPIITQSVNGLTALLEPLPPPPLTATRFEWEAELAMLLGVQGQINEAAGQRAAAVQAFTAAQKQWQRLADIDKDYEAVKQGLEWTKNRLQKLK